jgi:hypothetical protein
VDFSAGLFRAVNRMLQKPGPRDGAAWPGSHQKPGPLLASIFFCSAKRLPVMRIDSFAWPDACSGGDPVLFASFLI